MAQRSSPSPCTYSLAHLIVFSLSGRQWEHMARTDQPAVGEVADGGQRERRQQREHWSTTE